jgi:hypothetical protein
MSIVLINYILSPVLNNNYNNSIQKKVNIYNLIIVGKHL